jgi:hypothetical protein
MSFICVRVNATAASHMLLHEIVPPPRSQRLRARGTHG